MNSWDLKEICLALNKKYVFTKNIKIRGISIDSRKLIKGDLFIAIQGVNYDGHDFINEAIKKGASSIIAKKKVIKNNCPIIVVKDTKDALIELAKYSRNRIKNLKIIGITGSCGKTTLKEWLQQVLCHGYDIHCNYGNFNNDIGMPLTLCNMPKKTEICILEMGMNNRGEIKKLAKVAKPNISIITNVGSAHLGNLKSLEAIASEKSDIFYFSNERCHIILPKDSIFFDFFSKKALKKCRKVYSFGKNEKSIFKFEKRDKDVTKFYIHNKEFIFNKENKFINWEYNVVLILGIISILNLKIKNLEKKILSLEPIKGRGKVDTIEINNKKIKLIDESYNASPDSLKKALENLSFYKKNQNKIICIIGDMLELGKNSKTMHIEIAENLKKVKPNLVITVGTHTIHIKNNLPKTISSYHFRDYKKVYNFLIKKIDKKDLIMIKGSNSSMVNVIARKLLRKK